MVESPEEWETPDLVLEEYEMFLQVELRVKAVVEAPLRVSDSLFQPSTAPVRPSLV